MADRFAWLRRYARRPVQRAGLLFIALLALCAFPIHTAYASDCPPDDPSRSDCAVAATTARSPLVPLAGGLLGLITAQAVGRIISASPPVPGQGSDKPSQETTEEGGKQSEEKPKKKRWALQTVGTASALVGGGGVVMGFYLTNLDSGETRRLRYYGLAGGAGIGASGSWPSPTVFETEGDVSFEDFAGSGTTATVNADAFIIGYCWGYVRFHRVRTTPRWVSVSGLQSLGVQLSGFLSRGTWDYP